MSLRRRETVQLPLDLGHHTSLGRESFFAGPCNEDALRWIDRWPDWPAIGLALYGSPGCGKTHLAEIWREKSRAVSVAAASIEGREAADIAADAPAIVVEDITATVPQQTLFHLYNLLGERGGHILFTATDPPARMAFALPDLISRLRAMPAIEIADPDDLVLGGVMRKIFEDRQLPVSEDIIAYLLARMERSYAAARILAAEIDRLALAERRQVTIPLARLALSAQEGG